MLTHTHIHMFRAMLPGAVRLSGQHHHNKTFAETGRAVRPGLWSQECGTKQEAHTEPEPNMPSWPHSSTCSSLRGMTASSRFGNWTLMGLAPMREGGLSMENLGTGSTAQAAQVKRDQTKR